MLKAEALREIAATQRAEHDASVEIIRLLENASGVFLARPARPRDTAGPGTDVV